MTKGDSDKRKTPKRPRKKKRKLDVIEGCYFGFRPDGSFFLTGV